MNLSERFLNLVQQQLSSFDSDVAHLVVYVANTETGRSPSLELVAQWPKTAKKFPPVETDPELRTPSSFRRWYPLQEGSILLGVIRAEHFPADKIWPEKLDQRLQAVASAIASYLALELDQRRLLDELSEQREQIGLMVHQLRNPLAALRTYAQLLLRKIGPESQHRNLVEGLIVEQNQLNRYVSALDKLGQKKLPAKKSSSVPLLLPPLLPQASSFTLRSLLDPLLDRADATAKLQGRQWFGPSSWPDWTNDPNYFGNGLIAEIVANLLENAFRYTEPSSEIGVHLNEKGLCVWDSGKLIPENERQKIFQKGFRGKNTFNSSGSGLGLSLGRQLAEEMGSKLELIDSPSNFDEVLLDKGNAFVITLPKKLLPEK